MKRLPTYILDTKRDLQAFEQNTNGVRYEIFYHFAKKISKDHKLYLRYNNTVR